MNYISGFGHFRNISKNLATIVAIQSPSISIIVSIPKIDADFRQKFIKIWNESSFFVGYSWLPLTQFLMKMITTTRTFIICWKIHFWTGFKKIVFRNSKTRRLVADILRSERCKRLFSPQIRICKSCRSLQGLSNEYFLLFRPIY